MYGHITLTAHRLLLACVGVGEFLKFSHFMFYENDEYVYFYFCKLFHAYKITEKKKDVMVNVLKFQALDSIIFWPKFCFWYILKYLVEWQTV